MRLRHLLIAAAAVLAASPALAQPRLLIFSHTSGYRHESIPAAVSAVEQLARKIGAEASASEDPALFTAEGLRPFDAVVFLSSTTDPNKPESEWLVGERRAALQQFVRAGGAVIAIHAAADSHYHWPWYGQLIGGRFERHPEGTPTGKVAIVDSGHAATKGQAPNAERTDEWYYVGDYDPTSDLLATLDPQSIGEKDVNPNPMSWVRTVEGGRVFVTLMGHTAASYSEPWFLQHLEGGMRWALSR